MGLKTGPLGGALAPPVALTPAEAIDATKYTPRPAAMLRPEEFIAEEYLLASTLVTCACGGIHMQYECFLIRRHPNGAKGAHIRQRVEEMLMPLPVAVATCKPRKIPFCGKCWEKHSSMVKPHMPTTEEAWQEALKTEDARRLAAAARQRAANKIIPLEERVNIWDLEDLP